jgi:D-arabinose 1-dehydrogenase-like Zn-dependent alcohol dehydrogenase
VCSKGTLTCAMGSKGGFAEAIRVPADFAFPLPESLPSEAAAPLVCGGITVS